jgi:hypothetical protein
MVKKRNETFRSKDKLSVASDRFSAKKGKEKQGDEIERGTPA